uniref:Uncharacterized protein n=1 Tax=Timema genevievae TaxID=629358 RepID=A0A7R9PKF7_TIMGE|nr:unnamed protein product [Timema genevievae]
MVFYSPITQVQLGFDQTDKRASERACKRLGGQTGEREPVLDVNPGAVRLKDDCEEAGKMCGPPLANALVVLSPTAEDGEIELANELYQLSARRLLAKIAPTSVEIGCRLVSPTNPLAVNITFLDQSCYFFIQVSPHEAEFDLVPDTILHIKSRSRWDRTRDL